MLALLLSDLVQSSRRQRAVSARATDTILRAAAQMLLTKRGALGAVGRLPWNEHQLARRSATATRSGQEAVIGMRQ
ncbi:hypothetical protein ACFY91_25540 [Streptomyces albogriseolus]|uniref:hypothetical protein n=1 Tax=Streptomyces albogriseolus TaxID=1887 RepID=UPI0036E072A7